MIVILQNEFCTHGHTKKHDLAHDFWHEGATKTHDLDFLHAAAHQKARSRPPFIARRGITKHDLDHDFLHEGEPENVVGLH
jgi:hypothetical protein